VKAAHRRLTAKDKRAFRKAENGPTQNMSPWTAMPVA
jgi:hypothetical protein